LEAVLHKIHKLNSTEYLAKTQITVSRSWN